MTTNQIMLLCTSAAASAFNLAPDWLHTKTRQQPIALARHIAMYLARERFSLPFQTISAYFPYKRHHVAIYACNSMRNALDTNDREYAPKIRLAEKALEALMEDAA